VTVARPSDSSSQTLKLLGALSSHGGGWRYGYELAKETGLKSGSLYPILIRLADRGLLETDWEREPPRGRPPRHLYRLTPSGEAHLAQMERGGATGHGSSLGRLAARKAG
jgi:PadR family transcriptional regulator PadR